MSIFSNFFNRNDKGKSTASVAKQRLQVVIANDINSKKISPDVLRKIEMQIIKIFTEHIEIDDKNVDMKVVNENGRQFIELNVTLPD